VTATVVFYVQHIRQEHTFMCIWFWFDWEKCRTLLQWLREANLRW